MLAPGFGTEFETRVENRTEVDPDFLRGFEAETERWVALIPNLYVLLRAIFNLLKQFDILAYLKNAPRCQVWTWKSVFIKFAENKNGSII